MYLITPTIQRIDTVRLAFITTLQTRLPAFRPLLLACLLHEEPFHFPFNLPCVIIGRPFERSYSICPTPQAIIAVWRCEIAYNFPWCPVTWFSNSRLFFPGPACLTRHIMIRNEEKGASGVYVYKEGDVNVTQCLSLCEKIRLEEWKYRALMWLCSSEKHHSRL